MHSRPACGSPSPEATRHGADKTISALPVISERFNPSDAFPFGFRASRHQPDNHTASLYFAQNLSPARRSPCAVTFIPPEGVGIDHDRRPIKDSHSARQCNSLAGL